MNRLLLGALACAALSGCAEQGQVDDIKKDLAATKQQLKAAQDQIQALAEENSLRPKFTTTAYLDPADGGYSEVYPNIAPILFSFVDSVAVGDGTKITLKVANLYTASLDGAKLTVQYGPRPPADADRANIDAWQKNLRSIDIATPVAFQPGTWNLLQFSVPATKPDQIGFISIKPTFNVVNLR